MKRLLNDRADPRTMVLTKLSAARKHRWHGGGVMGVAAQLSRPETVSHESRSNELSGESQYIHSPGAPSLNGRLFSLNYRPFLDPSVALGRRDFFPAGESIAIAISRQTNRPAASQLDMREHFLPHTHARRKVSVFAWNSEAKKASRLFDRKHTPCVCWSAIPLSEAHQQPRRRPTYWCGGGAPKGPAEKNHFPG